MFTRNQKVVLACALITYIMTLVAFLWLDNGWIFLACFVLHSIFLLLFSWMAYHENLTNPNEIDELTERLVSVKTEWKEESERLKSEVSLKQDTIESLKDQYTELAAKNSELTEQIENMELEAARKEAEAKEKPAEPDASSILPSYLPERSETTTVNIIDVAKSVSKEFHDIAATAGLTINVSCSEDLLLVKADQNLLRTLFRNIIDNSIKYMNRHGSLIITISSIGDDIFVVCKDTGEGLSTDETKHIFELNFQGSNRVSGNGLGLFQAKAIVDYYGGTIYAKSNTGSGMGIYIQLPTT
ncbi:MAG: HAMP domain-containing histidine kinase [Lachnospiraceae bacterium]|nr:HAMP domain-containing histidine kinase [Lachnospiraceae bacterium]